MQPSLSELRRTHPRGPSSASRSPSSPPARQIRAELERAYGEYASLLRGFAHSLLRNEGDAEDLIHDVFIEAWDRWQGFDPSRGSLRSWLMLRVRCRAIDRLRARARQRQTPAPQPEESGEGDPLRMLQGDRAWRVLAGAPPRLHQVVQLRFGQDLSVAEAAEQIGVPVGTVKSRQSHAMRYLREQLQACDA